MTLVTHSGSSYGTCGFTPDADADGYTAYADITEAQAIGWVKDDMGEEAVTALEALYCFTDCRQQSSRD